VLGGGYQGMNCRASTESGPFPRWTGQDRAGVAPWLARLRRPALSLRLSSASPHLCQYRRFPAFCNPTTPALTSPACLYHGSFLPHSLGHASCFPRCLLAFFCAIFSFHISYFFFQIPVREFSLRLSDSEVFVNATLPHRP
jgi:hypothetical protein